MQTYATLHKDGLAVYGTAVSLCSKNPCSKKLFFIQFPGKRERKEVMVCSSLTLPTTESFCFD